MMSGGLHRNLNHFLTNNRHFSPHWSSMRMDKNFAHGSHIWCGRISSIAAHACWFFACFVSCREARLRLPFRLLTFVFSISSTISFPLLGHRRRHSFRWHR